MRRPLALITALLLGSAFARPLTTVQRQEVAQQILQLPNTSRAVREGRLFALTWLGDRAGLHEALKAPQPATLQSAPIPATSQLIPVAIAAGHPELLEEFQLSTQDEWSRLVRSLAGDGQYELADQWLKRMPGSPQKAIRLAEAATMGALNWKTDSEAQRWVTQWAKQAEAGFGALSPIEQGQARHMLAAAYARLHDLNSLQRLLKPLTPKEHYQRLGELALEASMSDPTFAPQLLGLMQPGSVQERMMMVTLWAELHNLPEVQKQLAQLPTSDDKDRLLLNLAVRQIEAGHPEVLPKFLTRIQSPVMGVSALAEVATRLTGKGRPELAAKYIQQAHDLALIRRLDTADLRLALIQAYGATGRTADAEELLTGVQKQPQLRIAYLAGLVTGNYMEEALKQAALIQSGDDLGSLLTTFQLLLQRQRYAELRSLLAVLKPVLLAQTSPEGRIVRGSYFSFLVRAGAPDALKDLSPQDETGMLLYDASTSGRLDLLPTLLARAADPNGELGGINEGSAALSLIQSGYSEKALTLFRQMSEPEAKAMIGIALLSNDEPAKLVKR